MAIEELAKTCANLRDAGLDFALLSSHENVAYVSGFDTPAPMGAATDFSGATLLPLWFSTPGRRRALIVADTFGGLASHRTGSARRCSFPSSTASLPWTPCQSFVSCVREALHGAGLRAGSHARIGVELGDPPVDPANLITESFSTAAVASCRPSLEKARRSRRNANYSS